MPNEVHIKVESDDNTNAGFDSVKARIVKLRAELDLLMRDLDKLGRKTITPKIELQDKTFRAQMADATKKADVLSRKKITPKIDLSGVKTADAAIDRLNAKLDRLNHKRVTATVKVDTDRSFLSRLFGGGGGGGGGFLSGLLSGGGGAAGQSASSGASGILGAFTNVPWAQALLWGGAGLAGAAVAPALLPAALGLGAGGGAVLGGAMMGKADYEELQKLNKQLNSMKLPKNATTAQKTAFNQQKTGLQQQINEINKTAGGPLAIYGGIQNIGEAAKGMFNQALTARPVVGYRQGPGRTGAPIYGQSFVQGLTPILKQVGDFTKTMGPQLGDMFRASLPFLKLFVGVMEQAAKIILPAVTQSLKQMAPYLPTLMSGFVAILQGVANMIKAIGPRGMQAAASNFMNLCKFMGLALTVLGKTVNFVAVAIAASAHWIHKTWDDLRHHTAVIFDGIRHEIVHVWDIIWNNTIGMFIRFNQAWQRRTDDWRHHISVLFDGIRHEIAHVWDLIWNNTIGRLKRGLHDAASLYDGWRHNLSHWYDIVRHDIAHVWDVIWSNTIGKIKTGISTAVSWFKGMPSRLLAALAGLGTMLWQKGADVLNFFLNGVKHIWNDVSSWFAGMPGKILHALGIHSPPDWAISAGKHVMSGILKGLAHGKDVKTFFVGLAQDILGPLKSIWHSLFGSGGGSYGGGVARWTSDVVKALQMEGLPLSLTNRVLYQMQTESGGNPRAINLTDINAQQGDPSRGLLQTIMATFMGFHWPGTSWDIYDPLANIAAAINYARTRYGPTLMSGGMGMGSGHGYDEGGWLPTGLSLAINKTGRPERVIGPNEGISVHLVVEGGATEFDRFMIRWIREFVKVRYGGNVQAAFGARQTR